MIANDNIRPYRKTKLGKFLSKFGNRALRLRKWVYQTSNTFSYSERRHLFIFGCQRSGTTLLGRVFDRDLRSAVLQEINCLTESNKSLRFKALTDVRDNLEKIRAPLVVVKPLVESHRAPEILRDIPQSKGIWMFRNYKDVVSSNVKRFSSQVEGLKMAITGQPPSWRSEGISNSVRSVLNKFYFDDMDAADAAALGWYSINSLFFDLQLNNHPKIKLCKYEIFCEKPSVVMKELYSFIGMPYPKWDITREVDKKSVSLGRKIILNKEIEALCDDLQNRIQKEYDARE